MPTELTEITEIIVAGWIDWDPADRDEALALLGEMARHSLVEDGCLDYAMSADPDDPRRIRVFERWASADDLAAHFTTAHTAEFYSAAAKLTRLDRSLARYVVASKGPVR